MVIIISNKEELQLLIDVSVMYYLEGKTQSEIARQFYLSRPKISRLLKKARENQIVEININYQSDAIEKLQSIIKRKFKVDKVILSKTLTDNNDTLIEVAKLAAKEFVSQINENMTIGISWGRSVRTTASYIKRTKIDNVKVAELFGAVNQDMKGADMLSIGRSISSKIGAKLYTLPAPIYIEDKNVRNVMIANPVIKQSLEIIEGCDLIISGIGSLDNDVSAGTWDYYLSKEIKHRVMKKGAIGFLCAHFFDKDGKFVDDDVNNGIIGIKTDSIKKKKNIIIASGLKKAKLISALLKAGCINTLISDEDTMKLVLKYSQRK